MPKQVSGKRYAQALFELATEQGQLEQWAEDLRFATQVLQDAEYRAFLKHADVPLDQKLTSINTVFRDIHPMVRNMVSLLVSKGMVEVTLRLEDGYTALLDEHLGRQRVQITSAVPLDAEELERINRFVADMVHKQVMPTTRVDESILGGVIIQIGDRLLDGSTRSRLEALRNRIHSEMYVSRS